MNSACQKMKNRLVLVFRSTGGDHICALNEDDAVAEGLELCNKYRKGVGLSPLTRFFTEDRSPPQEKLPATSRESDKERRSREYRERTKKMMDDLGLSSQSE